MTQIQIDEDAIRRYRRLVREGTVSNDDGQRAAIEKLQMIRTRFLVARSASSLGKLLRRRREEPGDRGLYIYGSVGRGKSMLMDIFFETMPEDGKRRVHFHEFMQEIHRTVQAVRRRGTGTPVQEAADGISGETRLLCFDEFQVEDITDAMILGQLFESLFAAGVTIIATSNSPPKELYRDGLNRDLFLPFLNLISQRLDLHHLCGPRDYRIGGAESGVYFAPAGFAADEAMEAAWIEVTAGQPETVRSLSVLGREIVIPRSCGPAARVDFETLCGGPLGPADCLAIAEAFETVFIDRIPRLPPARRDPARRLVILIDALYERSRKLVVSADGEPEQLYPGGDGAGAFARTASRLHEMRSTGYPAGGRNREPVTASDSSAAAAAQRPSVNSSP